MSSKKVMVTGSGRGIGRATAKRFAQDGFDVWVAGRDMVVLRQLAEDIGGHAVQLDLLSDRSIAEVGDTVAQMDVLVNNAGVLSNTALMKDPSGFDAAIQVMLRAPYQLMQAAWAGMAKRRYGRIVNVSSGWGSFSEGLGGPGAYGVAKAGLNALTLAASREAPKGCKVNALCPGWVATDMGGVAATRSAEEAAEDVHWLATLPENGPNGGFFRQKQPVGW